MKDKQGAKRDVTDDKQRRLDLYDATRKELVAQKSSNSEAYDKAVLTLSSAFLGVSLAFLKDSGPGITCVSFLLASWICLTFAIITTVISFQLSNSAADVQMDQAERFYFHGDALDKAPIARYVDYVNWAAGTLFVFGVLLTVVFVSINLLESHSMSKISHANDGQSISKLQQVEPLQKGQSINNLQKINPAPAPAPVTPPTTTPKK